MMQYSMLAFGGGRQESLHTIAHHCEGADICMTLSIDQIRSAGVRRLYKWSLYAFPVYHSLLSLLLLSSSSFTGFQTGSGHESIHFAIVCLSAHNLPYIAHGWPHLATCSHESWFMGIGVTSVITPSGSCQKRGPGPVFRGVCQTVCVRTC